MTVTLAASMLADICERAARRYGVLVPTLLRAASLTEDDLRDPNALLPADALSAVLRTLRTRTGDPGVGVQLASQLDLRTQGFFGYALLSSTTFGERLDLHVRYQRLRSPIELTLTREADSVILGMVPRGLPLDVAPVLMDFGVTSGLMHLRAHLAGDMAGVRLMLGYAQAPHHRAVQALLVEPIVFDAPFTQLWLPSAALPRKLDGDPHLGALASQQLDAQLGATREASGQPLPETVRERLRARLDRDPTLQSVARDLALSARTLQRQLGAYGVSFQALLEDVRRGQALHYVGETEQAIERIAERLGYGDASSFRRAFRRWTGVAPAEYRRAHDERASALVPARAPVASNARPPARKGSAA